MTCIDQAASGGAIWSYQGTST